MFGLTGDFRAFPLKRRMGRVVAPRSILGLYRDNGKENGTYMDYRGYIGVTKGLMVELCTCAALPPFVLHNAYVSSRSLRYADLRLRTRS